MVTNSEGQVYTGDPAAVPVISQIAIPEGTTAGTGADFSASGSAVVFSQETPTIGAVLMADLTGNTVTTLLDESGGEVSLRSNGSVYVSTTGSNSLTVFGEDLATNYPVSMASALTGSLSGKGYISGSGNSNEQVYARFTGLKQYELKDHLGNVRGVVSDLKTATGTGNVPTNDADVLAYYNYYPFGLQMHGRYNPTNPAGKGGYRYGFNGKEKDDDIAGSIGAVYDYGFRIYDSRIGKFLSVDPLTKEYPWNSTYAFAENDVIRAIDLEGAEKYFTITGNYIGTSLSNKSPNSIRIATSYSVSKNGTYLIYKFNEVVMQSSKEVGKTLENMWNSSLSDNKNERSAYGVLDTKEATFKLSLENDNRGNTPYNSKFKAYKDFGVLRPYATDGSCDYNKLIIFQIHDHPVQEDFFGKKYKETGEIVTDRTTYKDQFVFGGDGFMAKDLKIPFFSFSTNNLDLYPTTGMINYKNNNISNTYNLFNGGFNLLKLGMDEYTKSKSTSASNGQ